MGWDEMGSWESWESWDGFKFEDGGALRGFAWLAYGLSSSTPATAPKPLKPLKPQFPSFRPPLAPLQASPLQGFPSGPPPAPSHRIHYSIPSHRLIHIHSPLHRQLRYCTALHCAALRATCSFHETRAVKSSLS
ncbi:hypothetical protein NA56DRAFT_136712 [Hyaloscypha hepaticicola]|uniref:Uncharacterized protein n=1 Tax=Hyaloscypha hepaticicola TaxID=2082293 RepID=A0A2J6QMN8_9HELO|nr:hypothetical protein NA56DRAFT_136712 [Hyaloscypha hepaticicola]